MLHVLAIISKVYVPNFSQYIYFCLFMLFLTLSYLSHHSGNEISFFGSYYNIITILMFKNIILSIYFSWSFLEISTLLTIGSDNFVIFLFGFFFVTPCILNLIGLGRGIGFVCGIYRKIKRHVVNFPPKIYSKVQEWDITVHLHSTKSIKNADNIYSFIYSSHTLCDLTIIYPRCAFILCPQINPMLRFS